MKGSKQKDKDAQKCFSFKFELISKSNLDVETGKYFAFPALHVLLGLTDKLCESLEGVWPDSRDVYN